MKKLFILFFALGVSQHVLAKDVHKCENNGSVTYQTRPCAGAIRPSQQLEMQKKLAQKTANQNAKMQQIVQASQSEQLYSQQQHLQRKTENRTSNEIADTVEGKKKSLAIAQEAYKMTKNR